MNAPTGDELEAVQRIAARPEGQVVLRYLQKNMEQLNSHLVQERDPVGVRLLQGQMQVLTVLTKAWKP